MILPNPAKSKKFFAHLQKILIPSFKNHFLSEINFDDFFKFSISKVLKCLPLRCNFINRMFLMSMKLLLPIQTPCSISLGLAPHKETMNSGRCEE